MLSLCSTRSTAIGEETVNEIELVGARETLGCASNGFPVAWCVQGWHGEGSVDFGRVYECRSSRTKSLTNISLFLRDVSNIVSKKSAKSSGVFYNYKECLALNDTVLKRQLHCGLKKPIGYLRDPAVIKKTTSDCSFFGKNI